MLNHKEYQNIEYSADHILDDVIEYLYEDIINTVKTAGHKNNSLEYELFILAHFGVNNKKINKELQMLFSDANKNLHKILELTAVAVYSDDFKRITGSSIKVNKKRLEELTEDILRSCKRKVSKVKTTMGFIAPDGKFSLLTDAYRKACDFAFEKTIAGELSYDEAVLKATEGLIKKGIQSVEYESGRITNVRDSTRRDVMTSVGELTNRISEENHKNLGCNGWEISAHSACAPDHEPYQGNQYSDKEFEVLNNSLKRPFGLFNCGHIKFPIIVGKTSPVYNKEQLEDMKNKNKDGVYYKGRHFSIYEATQKQREIERNIRRRKEQAENYKRLGTIGEEEAKKNNTKLKQLYALYNDFSKTTGIPKQNSRLRINAL